MKNLYRNLLTWRLWEEFEAEAIHDTWEFEGLYEKCKEKYDIVLDGLKYTQSIIHDLENEIKEKENKMLANLTPQQIDNLRPLIEYTHFNVGPGQATVAGILINDTYCYGISLCSPEDQFNKHFGRFFALEKLFPTEQTHSFLAGRLAICNDLSRKDITGRAALSLKLCLKDLREFGHWRPATNQRWWSKLNLKDPNTISIRGKRSK